MINDIILKLFNAVEVKTHDNKDSFVLINDINTVIDVDASYTISNIIKYFKENRLNVTQYNKSFYKTWNTVENKTRYEQYVDQILHYASTYGTNFTGEIYIPADEFDTLEDFRLFKVASLTKDEIITKCTDMLYSGMAMKQTTITDVLQILEHYDFTPDIEQVKNKEALCILAVKYNTMPANPVEALRVLIYKATGSTLLIKNRASVYSIKTSETKLKGLLNDSDVISLSTIFNRFKPLFLAFKTTSDNAAIINRISKLSKKNHKPMIPNILNTITSKPLEEHHLVCLRKSTSTVQLIKALNACVLYFTDKPANRLYKIRNGKSFIKNKSVAQNSAVLLHNGKLILEILNERIIPTTVYIPKDIYYGLPLSEKHFADNIPFGTIVTSEKDLITGIYWENQPPQT